MHTRRTLLKGLLATGASGALWLPSLHLVMGRARQALALGLAETQLRAWESSDSRTRQAERAANPEWDFMGRTFLVMGLANLALQYPACLGRHLAVIDTILQDTLRQEANHGRQHFMLPYGAVGSFRNGLGQSLFIEGEIALMLGVRRLLRDHPRHAAEQRRRVARCRSLMAKGPVLCGESYPDECWTFCNTLALAALASADAVDGSDHRGLMAAWVANAREHLIDPDSGMLISSFSWRGRRRDGPEGSSLWLAATCLQLIDPSFAQQQYSLGRQALLRRVLGFGYAREWAPGHEDAEDIDSGPIVPLLEASTSSSGMALLAAAAFDDQRSWDSLVASLGLAAFPIDDHGALRFAASNQVGDSMILAAASQGPLWQAIQHRRAA